MSLVAFLMDILCSSLYSLKLDTGKKEFSNIFVSYLIDICFSLLYAFVAAAMTLYVAPVAMGSGVAECMGMLNGVMYRDYVSLRTLIVKFLGVSFAVAAGLCGGKEGPLVHIGYIVGNLVAYLPFKFELYFRNDLEKRKLGAIGLAAGVSAAFGAPIGGSLFAFELSKPNTFWSFSLTWKVFFASSISAFFLECFQ
jgi:H+/Cl- antiporter ClcA